MTKRLRLLLLLPHLGGGGAERVFELLAQHLPAERYELHLGLVTKSSEIRDEIPRSVTIHRLGASRVRAGSLGLLCLVWRLKPDVVLSNMAHLNFLVLLLRILFPRRTRVLVRQNGTVSRMLCDSRSPRMTRTLYRLLYRRADTVLCQSAAMALDLARYTGVRPEKITILPNPVDIKAIRATVSQSGCRWSGPGPHLLFVGRLAPEKGADLLLSAFARLLQKVPTADLTLAGTGSEEAKLRQQVHALGLEGAVRFPGYTSAPAAYYVSASLFVLPSRHEGMPNALLEAAAGGLPIVTTPASDGLLELVQGQPGVWVANGISSGALEEALTTALNAIRPGQRYEHSWIQPFELVNALARYQVVIDDATNGTAHAEFSECTLRY